MTENQDNECTLTSSLLKTKSGEFDLESIHTLDLSHMDLTDVGCLGECSGLERLDLSFNNITKLHTLAGLTNLTDLDLSANRLTSLEGLQSLDKLRTLNLSGNLIGSIETLKCLSSLEKLTYLRLKDDVSEMSNPLCMNTSYRQDVLSVLPNLLSLDDERQKGHGKELLKLCSELDSIINENQSSNDLPAPGSSWIPDDYWTREPYLDHAQLKLDDAEQNLRNLLAECKDVCVAADDKLKSLAHECFAENSVS